MTLMLYALSAALLSLGLYCMAQAAFAFPSGKSVRAVQEIHGRRGLSQRVQNALLPLAKLISKLFPMSDYRRKRMEADFARLRIAQKPEDFVSKAKARSLLLALIGLLFIPLGIPLLVLLTVVISLLAYFKSMQAIRKKVEALNREIESELPRLVETLSYSLQHNRDLLDFFDKYRNVAGKGMGAELDQLIAQMRTGNQEAALRSMDARIGLPSFAALCAILCGVHQGVDQRTSLLMLEQDMRTKERETLRRLMEKRPSRIKAASFILTILMVFMFMVPLIILIIQNIQAVGF